MNKAGKVRLKHLEAGFNTLRLALGRIERECDPPANGIAQDALEATDHLVNYDFITWGNIPLPTVKPEQTPRKTDIP